MIRKGFMSIIAVGSLLFGTHLQAKPPEKGPLMDIFTQEIELDNRQYKALKELQQVGKVHLEMRRDRKAEHLEWLESYAAAEISRSETQADIVEIIAEKQSMGKNKMTLIFAFVDSLSDDQKSQAIDNLDVVKIRHEKHLARKERALKKHQSKEKFDVLFVGMNLSDSQQQKIQDIYDGRLEQQQERMRSEKKRINHLEKVVSGKISLSQAMNEVKDKIRQGSEFYQSMTTEWMDLIDSMSNQQKDEFLQNIADVIDMRSRHLQRKRRFHRGPEE